ncbi:hypothetical protein BGW38_009824, partial [Lunasporangiospora selenospora]
MSTNWTSSAQTRCVVPTTQTVVGYQSSAMVFHQITSPAGHAYVYDNGTTTDFFLFSELRSLESTKLYANTANGGYLVHFDTYRSGSVYTMSHSTGASEVASVRTPATAIKMDDIVLTSDAIGVNVGPTAYIVDK